MASFTIAQVFLKAADLGLETTDGLLKLTANQKVHSKTDIIPVSFCSLGDFVSSIIYHLGRSYPDGCAEIAQRGNFSQEGGNCIERHCQGNLVSCRILKNLD